MVFVDNKKILSELKEYKKFKSDTEFAEFLGISPQRLFNWRKRNTFDKNKIVDKFPEIRPAWLLTGEGEMLKTNEDKSLFEERTNETQGYRLVPLINLDAVGGMHSSNEESDVVQHPLSMVPFPKAEAEDICMRVSGNSMIPTYPPGSILLLRAVPDWSEYFGYGHTFVIGLKDGRRILKEVTRYDADPKHYILCVSHNKEFPSEELPKSMITSVYKVVMSLTNEGF